MNKPEPYQCPECGLHYDDEQTAKDCYEFCTKNHACSIEVTRHSVEYRRLTKKPEDSESGDNESRERIPGETQIIRASSNESSPFLVEKPSY